jgi:AcrR family transcriptional regulator
MTKTDTKFEQRREEIVSVATTIMSRKGVRGMTLQQVAADLGLAPRAVGYYFRHKEEIAAACYMRGIERMNELLSDAVKKKTAEDALRTFVGNFFENHRRIQVGDAKPTVGFEEMRTLADAETYGAYNNMFRKLRSIFTLKGAPVLDRTARNARAHMLLSQMFWAGLWLPRYNPEDHTLMADRITDILLKGLAVSALPRKAPNLVLDGHDKVAGPDFLGAATDMINAHGYRGASVSKISAQLNVTKGSFYHHIEAKDDLVEQCFIRTWAILRRAQAAADQTTRNGLINLFAQSRELIIGQVTGERPLLRTSALAAVPEAMRPRLLEGFERVTNRYASVVSDGIADGSIRILDVPVAAHMVSGAINAAAELHYFVPGVTAETADAVYLRPLFIGMLSPST